MGTYLGFLLVVFPEGVVLMGLVLFIGWIFGAYWSSSVGYLLLPLLSIMLDQPVAITLGCLVIIAITATKRLEANRRPIPQGRSRWPVIGRRLWLDRDIPSHEEWMAQGKRENR
jgi:hypothetical protein